jgi:serine/threonine protein kinase, bacterial
MKFFRLLVFWGISALLIFLAGCGGGNTNPAQMVSGVAAAGSSLGGTVYLKDSANPAQEISAPIAADGSFSFNVGGLTPPFLLKAVGNAGGNSYTLYSFAAGTGVANINPLSNLAVAEANGGDVSSLYAAPNSTKLQTIKANIPTAVAQIQASLQQTLSHFGAANVDFIYDPYVANHQGLDLLFDLISISVSNGTVTIVDKTLNNTVSCSLGNFLTNEVNIAGPANNSLLLLPAAPSVATNGTINFTAVVVGTFDQQIAWSMVEPSGGTITSSGSYTAPVTAGTYHVKATSVADRTKSATVTVTVTPPPPVVTVLAGSGTMGSPVDGTGSAAVFFYLSSVAADGHGNLYVVDSDPFYRGGLLRKITSAGVVTTLALTDSTGAVIQNPNLSCIALDSFGTIYAASGNMVEKITPAGAVSFLAGSFGSIHGLAVDLGGNVYVGDGDANKILKITPSGMVSTLAGSGLKGADDGTGSAASFDFDGLGFDGIAIDSLGNLYVVDPSNEAIRKITPAGVVSTLAKGGSLGIGPVDGPVSQATFSGPGAIAVDGQGNIYLADYAYNIRMISTAGFVSTIVSNGPGSYGGLSVDNSGNLYATTWPSNAEVLKIKTPQN